MRNGLRSYLPVQAGCSDDELVERTRLYRPLFNEHYRVHGCVSSAQAYGEAMMNAQPAARGGADEPSMWDDAA